MLKKIFVLILLTIFSWPLSSQIVTGSVNVRKIDNSVEHLPFASVYWPEWKISVEADENGHFHFDRRGVEKITVIATHVGYSKDTVVLDLAENFAQFTLVEDNVMEEVKIVECRQANYLSKIAPVKTEIISEAGLHKMACCNLAESFENSASVTVGYSDAITGARQIRLLGLSGIYTQMLDENRPVMRGIAAPFGLSYIPGQWLESIQIAKGPSSVINGLEAITGQINMEHRKPAVEQPLLSIFS